MDAPTNVHEYLSSKSRPGDDGCVGWTGCLRNGGYGAARWAGREVLAHRLAYEVAYGPIPDGMFACHTCDNRRCINPMHLFLGTHRANMRDMAEKGRADKKLTAEQVRAICADTRKGVVVAEAYGISQSMVSMIRRGRTRRLALAALL